MTDNVGKFLFEITSYGSIWPRGQIIRETEKMWEVEDGRRVLKGANIIPSDAGGKARAEVVSKTHEAECRRLEEVARDARRAQREAVIAALRPIPETSHDA